MPYYTFWGGEVGEARDMRNCVTILEMKVFFLHINRTTKSRTPIEISKQNNKKDYKRKLQNEW